MEKGNQTEFEMGSRDFLEREEGERANRAWVKGLPWLYVVYAEEILEGRERDE